MTDIEGEMEQQKGLATTLALLRTALGQVNSSNPEKTTLMSAIRTLLAFFEADCAATMTHNQYLAMESDSERNAILLLELMVEFLVSKGFMSEDGMVYLDEKGNFTKPPKGKDKK